MTLSVRLDDETKKLLTKLARSRRASRSEIVRQAIRAMAKEDTATGEVNAYERIKHLVGSVQGLPADLSTRGGDYFHELLLDEKRKGRL